jgi:AraC-like DNA-binding protein
VALDLILANERIVSRSRVWRNLDAMEIQHLHASGGWKLLAVACRESMPGRGPTEIAGYSSFSLVRRGTFCVHRGALTTVADPLTLLEFRTGEEYRVSHPLGCGDDCIELACSDQTMDELHSGSGRCASPSTAWRLGNLARRATQGLIDDLELEESAALLLARPPRPLAPRLAPASLRKVEYAKLAMLSDPGRRWSLAELARQASCSPFHLTRLFRRATGCALHRFLVLIRLALALERILDGHRDLVALACDLGFASHSHLATAFRDAYGVTPSAARAAGMSARS